MTIMAVVILEPRLRAGKINKILFQGLSKMRWWKRVMGVFFIFKRHCDAGRKGWLQLGVGGLMPQRAQNIIFTFL